LAVFGTGCNETVDTYGGEEPVAVDRGVPASQGEREIVIVCPRGHRKLYCGDVLTQAGAAGPGLRSSSAAARGRPTANNGGRCAASRQITGSNGANLNTNRWPIHTPDAPASRASAGRANPAFVATEYAQREVPVESAIGRAWPRKETAPRQQRTSATPPE